VEENIHPNPPKKLYYKVIQQQKYFEVSKVIISAFSFTVFETKYMKQHELKL
jgi:hypothetical protein